MKWLRKAVFAIIIIVNATILFNSRTEALPVMKGTTHSGTWTDESGNELGIWLYCEESSLTQCSNPGSIVCIPHPRNR